ncbi:ATP-binding protein [Thioclava sp. GXIMD2076]|uniref:histidine kinase n=1 Tax=Thioclava kandeliae TaxID=3070818 RepID=A0ABV1SBA0_9RHOB
MTLPAPGVIWNSLPIPALLIDRDDCVSEVNPSAEQFLNLSARAMQGKSVSERLAINAPLEEIFARTRAGQTTVFVNDVEVTTGEKAPVQCNLQTSTLGSDPDQILFLITPRELSDRLGRANMAKSAARSAIGMAEMLAHEIKNPLAGIAGAAQLLSMGLTGEDLELTDLIVDETRRVVKLLEQVEQFGNVRPPEKKPVNIHDVLDRARKSAEVGFGGHMEIRDDYDPSLPLTLGDADQLVQVFLNLLKNASQAAKTEGTITIRTFYEHKLRIRTADGRGKALPLQVEIIDDGPGIPADIAANVFEPFVSGRENGTGLGLALVSKIISDHDGWINLDSVPGRTVFRISLPVAR